MCFHSSSPQWSCVGSVVREISSPLVLYFSIFINTHGAGVGKFMSSDRGGVMQVSAQGLKENKIFWVVAIYFALQTSIFLPIKKKQKDSHIELKIITKDCCNFSDKWQLLPKNRILFNLLGNLTCHSNIHNLLISLSFWGFLATGKFHETSCFHTEI